MKVKLMLAFGVEASLLYLENFCKIVVGSKHSLVMPKSFFVKFFNLYIYLFVIDFPKIHI